MTAPINRLHRTIDSTDGLDGLVVGWDNDIETFDDSLTADRILEQGLDAFDERSLVALPPEQVDSLAERAADLSDSDIQIAVEVAARIDEWLRLIPDDDGARDAPLAWKKLRSECNREWCARHDLDAFEPDPMPCYDVADGVPSANGTVASRLLSGWVVEMLLTDPDKDYRYAEPDRAVATVTDWFEISDVDPLGPGRELYNAIAWELEGLDEQSGERFAIAPAEPGEQPTLWVWDSFEGDWGTRRGVGGLKTWPNEQAWRTA